jgi:hypothetical protein
MGKSVVHPLVIFASLAMISTILLLPRGARAEGAAEQAKLVASDPDPDDRFGTSVTLARDIALVGAPLDDEQGTDAGAVYVFTRANQQWTQEAKLMASDAGPGDRFGRSIAFNRDLAVVGAPLKNDGAGGVYVFERSNTVWTEKARLVASDGQAGHEFGIAVAVDGDILLVGATFHNHAGDDTGMAYVFTREADTFVGQDRLAADDATAESEFGRSIAIEGGLAVIGAPGSGENRTMAGSAYLFESNGGRWQQVAKLTADDGEAGNDFGHAVAIDQQTVLVGAFHDSAERPNSGAAYLFVEEGSDWVQQEKFVVRDAKADDQFGYALALRDNAAIIGAHLNDHMGDSAGAAFLFIKNRQGWQERARITADDSSDFDKFGNAVALDSNIVLIGAHLHSSSEISAGAAYLYLFERAEGDACEASDQCSEGLCIDGYCCSENCRIEDASTLDYPDAGQSDADVGTCPPPCENNGCGCRLVGTNRTSRSSAWLFTALLVIAWMGRLGRRRA